MTREEKIKAIYEEVAERINFDGLDGQSLVTWDLAPVLIGDIIDYSYTHYGEIIVSKKIVALQNNRRVLIDLPKGVF